MPKTDDDSPLGGFAVTDVTPALPEPEDFDVDAWLAGVRPTRRAVVLYARADILARLDEIDARVRSLPDGDEVDALIDEFEALRAEYRDGRPFVVEGRSPEWVEHFKRTALADLGVRKGDGTREQRVEVMMAQLAEQIVSPEGLTVEHLQALNERNAGELNKLVVAMTFANNQVAEAAEVLTLDFSSRRSGTGRR